MKKISIYFIRHGESIANTKKLVTGDETDTLSPLGIQQAESLQNFCQEYFKKNNLEFDHLFTSTFRRAQQTAEIAFPKLKKIIDPRLSETNAGECKNWTCAEFDEKFADFWQPFDPQRAYMGGESHQDLANRVIHWVEEHITDPSRETKLLVVGHNGSLAALLHWALKVPMNLFPAFHAPNASLTHLELTIKSKQQLKAQLLLLGVK